MENTAGVIIYDISGKVLITKPTNGNIWSFPKGMPDIEEELKTAAIREVLEETSLDLSQIKGYFENITYTQKYPKRDKTIHLFIFKSQQPIEDNYEIKCDSYFELDGKKYPENDDHKWIHPLDALKYIHDAQKIILNKILNN